MLTIRLQRIGKKKKPYYRLVISEKTRDTQAKSLEILGNYGPTETPKILELKVDRIKHWLSVGAQTSNTVHNLLIREGVIEANKKKSVSITNKRKAKIDSKKVELEAKETEAKQKAADEKKAAEEAKKAEAEVKTEVKEETLVEENKAEEKPVKVEESKEEKVEEKKEESKKEEASAEEKKENKVEKKAE